MADTLDRKALTIYLDDVRTMEMIIHQSYNRIWALESKEKEWKRNEEQWENNEKEWERRKEEMDSYVASKYNALDEETNNYEFEKNNLENYLLERLPAYPEEPHPPVLEAPYAPKRPDFKTNTPILIVLAIVFLGYCLISALTSEDIFSLVTSIGLAIFSPVLLIIIAISYTPEKQEAAFNYKVEKNNKEINKRNNERIEYFNYELENYNNEMSEYNRILNNCKKKHHYKCKNVLKKS